MAHSWNILLTSEWLNAEKTKVFPKRMLQLRGYNFSSETTNLVSEKTPKLLAYPVVLEQQKALTCAGEVKTTFLKPG